ncbi:MAG: helix-turn-helix transcriptional regulator [Clostridia bacterium]|nr:helix-turn-helix transcriptional regulator [Clostridia bacterium]
MKFGEKLRLARKRKKLTQEELAKQVGVSKRTIVNYESGEIYPKGRAMYTTLANALELEPSYLLSEDEEFILGVNEIYGARGRMQARRLIDQVSAMFSGGELDDDDKLAFVHQIQELYLESKEYSKRFTPKKYQ